MGMKAVNDPSEAVFARFTKALTIASMMVQLDRVRHDPKMIWDVRTNPW